MQRDTYIDHLNTRLAEISQSIARARNAMERATRDTQVEAFRQLVILEQQKADLAQRVAEAQEMHAEQWSRAQVGMQEALDGLHDTFESWFKRYG
jgi:hypothetical protein